MGADDHTTDTNTIDTPHTTAVIHETESKYQWHHQSTRASVRFEESLPNIEQLLDVILRSGKQCAELCNSRCDVHSLTFSQKALPVKNGNGVRSQQTSLEHLPHQVKAPPHCNHPLLTNSVARAGQPAPSGLGGWATGAPQQLGKKPGAFTLLSSQDWFNHATISPDFSRHTPPAAGGDLACYARAFGDCIAHTSRSAPFLPLR